MTSFYCKDVILELGLEDAIRKRAVEQVWKQLAGLWVANLEALVNSSVQPVVDQGNPFLLSVDHMCFA